MSTQSTTPSKFQGMSPRYPKEVTAALKNVLRCRRDSSYHFTKEDIADLTSKTGLSPSEIAEWAHNVRRYYTSADTLEKFFERNETVSCENHHKLNHWHAVINIIILIS